MAELQGSGQIVGSMGWRRQQFFHRYISIVEESVGQLQRQWQMEIG
jgi:hypothetical protein